MTPATFEPLLGTRLIPPFDLHRVFVEPWIIDAWGYGWIAVMGFLVALACGLVGQFLVLRRVALLGDAISHSVLPGIALAFILTSSRSSLAIGVGAIAAGIITTVLIETIHRQSRVKPDAAIGIVFSALFAFGVILISLFADKVDLDADCVLYGEIALVPSEPPMTLLGLKLGPHPIMQMLGITIAIILLTFLFYKELLVTSFDPGLAKSLGMPVTTVHYGLMVALSVVVVGSFESVGAILVIAMLILPGSTALLLTNRMRWLFAIIVVAALLYSVLGLHLALWLDASIGACMVVAAFGLFLAAWVFSPSRGLLANRFRKAEIEAEPVGESS